ncbi:MAG: helix-turn-helix transcriptional regulator [Cardiobacteriaceae bacterium]|nr:helix-turn-helix transcriptional regulator [Cardiobacteriaceae bacterium]
MNMYANPFQALADTPQEAENLRIRAELMRQIAERVRTRGWTQQEAAAHCAITQPRMSDLLNGRLSKFTIDALVNIASALDMHIHLTVV